MCKVLDNSLYIRDKKLYSKIKGYAISFNALYNKNNIVQDDIFRILENYVIHHDTPFELLRFPIEDEEFCACTFMREGRMFVLINTAIPLSKQIFAAAHELYHIYCYFEKKEEALLQYGSLLESNVMDEDAKEMEDVEANAFAAFLLAPKDQLDEQSDIYNLSYDTESLQTVLKVMDIFSIPFKGAVLRLFEEGKISRKSAIKYLSIDKNEISEKIEITSLASRWAKPSREIIQFGSLLENMQELNRWEGVRQERLKEDRNRVMMIAEKLRRQTR